jgi:hypothetical protein
LSVVANVAKGRGREFADRVNNNDPANSAIVVVALKSAGLENDNNLQAYDTLADVLAGANDEATNVGYARITLDNTDGITVTVEDSPNHQMGITVPEQNFGAVAGAGGAWGKLVWCYDPDTTAGTDADLIPISFMDFTVTPDGNPIVSTNFSTDGFYRAVNP